MLISETTINCCKPNRFTTFKGTEHSDSPRGKVRYKHFEQMSDDMLQLRSVLKAHKDVQESNKMRLFKAMPELTTILLGTTIALTQPGKLAAKAGAGLGFLALTSVLCAGSNAIADKFEKNETKEKEPLTAKKVVKAVALTAGAIGVGALAYAGAKNSNFVKKATNFVSKELKQLTSEINDTKLAKFFDEKVAPFTQKHSKAVNVARTVAPLGVLVGSVASEIALADSLSEDIKDKAKANYEKGKAIQAQARAHFDSIDAQEV